ncbi:MAG: HAD-IA family hydrolase [Pseudomonadales bacterium]|nr:HAD-IA family hydrolase [Pseudomonadales bacterium]
MVRTGYLFDLDGTLYSRDELVWNLLSAQYDTFSVELGHVDKSLYIDKVVLLDAHGYENKEEVYSAVGKEFQLSNELERRLIEHFWACYDDYCHVPEDTLTTLATLKTRGKRMGVVTNGLTLRQNKKIDALGVRDYFSAIIISEQEGIKKPHPEIFARAAARIDCAPEECVFVGDHPVADIDGARAVGMAAVWKRVSYWDMLRDDVEVVDRLSDILIMDEDGF